MKHGFGEQTTVITQVGNENTADHGLVVNGDNVTAYGLFIEHFQKYDVIWRGEYGKTFFLQNEKCYDPQDQKEWMSHNNTVKGYSAYKVAMMLNTTTQ